MFEQACRNIDDALRKEAGCATELDYAEQTSWLLFLKYLDDLEQDRADEAALESCNLHTVLDCPGGTFRGAGVKTVVLFFEKGRPTRKVWVYQLDPDRNLGKTNPLNDDDLAEFVQLRKTFADSPKIWTVDASTLDPQTFDLSGKNPNGGETVTHRCPQEIMEEIAALDAAGAAVLENIRKLL
jgi:type I restriction enzyme M protein